MIVDALLNLFNSFLATLLALRPTWSMDIPDSIKDTIRLVMSLDKFLPITELLQCVALMATFYGAVLALKWIIKVVDWVAAIIP